jgi:hypothetical protein
MCQTFWLWIYMWGRVEIENVLETKIEDEVECHEFLETCDPF